MIGLASSYAAGPPAQRALLPSLNSTQEVSRAFGGPNSAQSLETANRLAQQGIYQGSYTSFSANLANSARKAPAPSKISASGSTVYGYVEYDDSNAIGLGLAEVFLDGTVTNVAPQPTVPMGRVFSTISCSYVRKNQFITVGYEKYYREYYMSVRNLDTNEVTYTKLDENSFIYYQFGAYDAEEDIFYGYIYDGTNVYFGYAPGENPVDFTPTGIFDWNTLPSTGFNVVATTFNPETQQFLLFFGEKADGAIYSADLTNGNLTEIGKTSVTSQYTTGACWSPYDNGYFYAVCNQDGCSIQLLDPTTFEVKSQVDYPNLLEYKMLSCVNSRIIKDSAPAEATFIKANFPEGAVDGSVIYKVANQTVAGTPILGNVDWILYVDGVQVKRGSAAAGSEISVPVTGLTEGFHTFKLRQSLGGDFGPNIKDSIYIGNDTPVAPEEVTLTAKEVSWTPVTTGIHGAYVNPEEVTYNVYLNDEILASNVKGTSCATKLADDVQLSMFTAAVEAVYDRKVSEKTYSNDISYGQPVEIPYSIVPTEKETRLFTIYNEDGGDGIYYYGGPHAAYGPISAFYYYGSYKDNGGAYLFLPPMKFNDTQAVYEFTAEIFATNSNYQETYEVVLATSPDPSSIVKTLINEKTAFNLANGGDHAPLLQTADFTVPSAGVYYIAIHGTSKKGERVWMCNFNVDIAKGLTPSSPDRVTDLTAVPGDKGALTANVSFKMPTATAGGTEFEATKTISATVQADDCEAVTVSGKPGETVNAVVKTNQGDNTILVTTADGDIKGLPNNISIYTGVYVPGVPTNLTAEMSADNFTAHLTWEPPVAADKGDGYVAPTGVTYYFCQKQGQDWVATNVIGTDVFSCDVSVPEGTAQSIGSFGILAENAAGMSSRLAVCNAVVGTPFEMPFTNNYYMGQETAPVVNYSNMSFFFLTDPKNFFTQFATPDNMQALFTYAFGNVVDAEFTIPKFSAVGAVNPAIELYVYGGSCPNFKLYASANGIPVPELIASYNAEDFEEQGPVKVRINLPEKFKNKGWIEPHIMYTAAPMSESFILYGFRYIDNIANDFGVTDIAGSAIARIGEEAKFVASVMNFGYEDTNFPGAEWKLTTADGDVLASVEVPAATEATPSDESFENEISFTPNAEQIGNLYLTYTIKGSDDKDANNSKTIEIPVITGDIPVVTDLVATAITHENVTLGWTEPAGTATNEVFEDEEPFILDDESDELAGFTRVDGDGATVYTLSNADFQALEFAGKPASFVTYSESELNEVIGENSPLKAHSGDKFIAAFCPGTGVQPEPAANDWLISPEIAGGSNISFFIKALTYAYGAETVQIMYSTTGTRPRNFKLLDTIELSGEATETPAYKEYVFTLPADAKYFAIHYVSQDIFGILIDDIHYTKADAVAPINNYEIYRDGKLIGTTEGKVASYADNTVKENTSYTYMVMPALNDGSKGLESNRLKILTSGVNGVVTSDKAIYAKNSEIVVKGFEGENITVATIDGKVIALTDNAQPVETIAVSTGVYVVKAGNSVAKVIVK